MISELVDHTYPRAPTKRTVKDLDRIQHLSALLETFRTRLTPLETQVISTDVAQLRLFQTLLDQRRHTNYLLAKSSPELQATLRILLSVPGIGPDTAFCILAELIDINYFPAPSKLAKWAGLAPRVHQSGHRKRITGKLHKGGNKYLRRALTLACTNIYARGDETHPIRQFIGKKYQETQKYWLAICAGARKLLTILWYMLQREQQWKPPTITDPKILKTLETKIQRKIQNHERQIRRYEQIQNRLTKRLTGQITPLTIPARDARELLRELLKAT
jgi:hypothetical protein